MVNTAYRSTISQLTRTPYNNIVLRARVGTNTPQSEPIPGENQVKNSAGGYAYQLDGWKQLDRFIILGTAGGTYYASEQKLTRDNTKVLEALIKEDGTRFVSRVVEMSARAPKADPALFALALAISIGDPTTKRLVALRLPEVARIGTHLFSFVEYAQNMRGWGRVLRDAISNWYLRHENIPVQPEEFAAVEAAEGDSNE
jgi:60 kDa SS-A/Ro ribonucleoprotein